MTDLWSASHLLHAGDSPILTELNNLVMDQTGALNDQIAASSMTIENLLKWVVPIVFLFVLLVVTQAFLRRRFRRAVSWPLLGATVALILLSIVTSLAVVSQHRLEIPGTPSTRSWAFGRSSHPRQMPGDSRHWAS